jgi:hypothetical protein
MNTIMNPDHPYHLHHTPCPIEQVVDVDAMRLNPEDFSPVPRRRNATGHIILPVFDIYHAHIPNSIRTEQLIECPEAGFIINNQVVEGYYVAGYPLVYIPGPGTAFSQMRRVPVARWANYSISRVALNERKRFDDPVELCTREDTALRPRTVRNYLV